MQAHIFVCFMAYVLRKTLEGWMSRAGMSKSAATVLVEMEKIQLELSVVPKTNRAGAVSMLDRAGSVVSTRCHRTRDHSPAFGFSLVSGSIR